MKKKDIKLLIIGSGSQANIVYNEAKKLNKYSVIKLTKFSLKNNFVSKKKNLNLILKKNFHFFIAIGDIKKRKFIYNILKKKIKKIKWAKIISNESKIEPNVKIGKGTIIHPKCYVNINSKIGDFCIINSNSVIEHDNIIKNFVTTGPRVTTCGRVKIGSNTFLGSGTLINNNISVGTNCFIGSKSLVNKKCDSNFVYYGHPVKKIKKNIF